VVIYWEQQERSHIVQAVETDPAGFFDLDLVGLSR
jgi:hypothetical protein